jgi:site-specific DNA-methyltransferase (adenine-specific)
VCSEPRLLVGDCLDRLPELTANFADAMVTDPPSGRNFGDNPWDCFGPERNGSATADALASYRKFLTRVFSEASRVLKPGAFAVVWAFPRTSHHTAVALEDAGFEVRDVVHHLFATGSPKSRCPGEWVDRSPTADAKEWGCWTATARRAHKMSRPALADALGHGVTAQQIAAWERGADLPSPRERMRLTKVLGHDGYVTAAAQDWEGFGTALKPAVEHWVLARKPLEDGDLGQNALHWGTGALHIDAVRTAPDGTVDPSGRWPTNLIMTHAPDCEIVSHRKVKTSVASNRARESGASGGAQGWGRGREIGRGDVITPSMETVPVWDCEEGCPVRLIETQSDRDGTSRYFPALRPEPDGTIEDLIKFVPKTAPREHPIVASGLPHPTTKSLPLMRWLVRLVTPPSGRVLDPFLGSGATAEAAMIEGFDWVGCEICDGSVDPATGRARPDYVSLVLARIERFRRGESPGQGTAGKR